MGSKKHKNQIYHYTTKVKYANKPQIYQTLLNNKDQMPHHTTDVRRINLHHNGQVHHYTTDVNIHRYIIRVRYPINSQSLKRHYITKVQ